MSLTTSRGDATVGQLCEAFGISRQTYYTARKAPRARGGQERGRIRRPERRGPWVSDATLIERIQRVVAEFPAWGVRKVWAYLRRLGTVVSRNRVWKRMKASGLTLPPISERDLPIRRGHVVVPESNRRWATDLTTTWTAQEGTRGVASPETLHRTLPRWGTAQADASIVYDRESSIEAVQQTGCDDAPCRPFQRCPPLVAESKDHDPCV